MSRANIESLLRLQQVQPNVEPIALQPQFLSSEISGGQIQLGQAQQQIGPTAEMAEAEQLKALADIAGGVQRGIDIFSDISSRIEKSKIDKAETFFDELSNREDLTPDQKQDEYDKYMKDVYTPVLGTEWKRKLNVKTNRMWTSTKARNEFESSRYEREYNAWKRLPANIDRPETNELYQEFNNQYLAKYPSSNNNDWFTAFNTKINTAIDLDNAQQTLKNFASSLDKVYDIPDAKTLEEYNGAIMEEQTKIEQEYAQFFSIKKEVEQVKDLNAAYEVVYRHVYQNLVEPRIKEYDEPTRKLIMERVDELALAKTQEIVNVIRKERMPQLQREAALNLFSNEMNYEIDKNVDSFLNGWTRNVGNLKQADRFAQSNTLLTTLWSGAQKGQSQGAIEFRQLPLDEQINKIESDFRSWLSKGNNKEIFRKSTGLDSDESIEKMIERSKFAIIEDNTKGGEIVQSNFKRFDDDMKRIKVTLPLITSSEEADEVIGIFEDNTAKMLGIKPESLEQLIAEVVTEDGQAEFMPQVPTYTWYSKLSPEEQKALRDRGYTSKNFELLENFRVNYTDLIASALKPTGTSTSKKDGEDLPVKVAELSDTELQAKVLTNPAFRETALVTSNEQNMKSLSPAAQQQAVRIQGTILTEETGFKAYIAPYIDQGELIMSSFSLFTETDGTPITEPITPQNFIKNGGKGGRYLDQTGSLTDEGKRNFLRLRYIASRMVGMAEDNPQKNEFAGQIKDMIFQIGQNGLSNVMETNPAAFYSFTAVVSGLAEGSPDQVAASTFLGQDSELMDSVTGLLIHAGNLSGGIIDLSPDDQGDPTRPPIESRNPMKKTIAAYVQLAEIFVNPIPNKGGGTMNPLVKTREYSSAVDIRSEVGNFFSGISRPGPNSYRSEDTTTALLQRLNFERNKGETEDQFMARFGIAIWNMTGGQLPAINDPNPAQAVIVNTDSNTPVQKLWTDMENWEKINYYLNAFRSIHGENTDKLFEGWLRISTDDRFKEFRTLDMFEYTSGFYIKDLLDYRSMPGLQQHKLPKYIQRNYETTSPIEARLGLGGMFGYNSGQQVLNYSVVDDAVTTRHTRQNLFNLASRISGSTGIVNTTPVVESWQSPGQFKDKMIAYKDKDGKIAYKSERVLLNQTNTEDEFVIDTLLAQGLDTSRQAYTSYTVIAKAIGQKPVDQETFNSYVAKNSKAGAFMRPSAYGALSGGTLSTEQLGPGLETTDKIYPPLFQVIAAFHKVDLTDAKRNLRVDRLGNMYIDIGNYGYKLPLELFETSLGTYTNKDDLTKTKSKFAYNKERLEMFRKSTLFAKKEGKTPYTILDEVNK